MAKVKKRATARGPRKVPMKMATVEELAGRLDQHFASRIAAGYALAGASGFWLLKDGTITARFVYRKGRPRDADGQSEITCTIKGIPFPR